MRCLKQQCHFSVLILAKTNLTFFSLKIVLPDLYNPFFESLYQIAITYKFFTLSRIYIQIFVKKKTIPLFASHSTNDRFLIIVEKYRTSMIFILPWSIFKSTSYFSSIPCDSLFFNSKNFIVYFYHICD